MCRIHQGYIFRCPADHGGCGNEFFQTQQSFLEKDLVKLVFAGAGQSLLRDPAKIVQVTKDPKTTGERARRDRESTNAPFIPEKAALLQYCKLRAHPDDWKKVNKDNMTEVCAKIQACGGRPGCRRRDFLTVTLWDYFNGDVFTEYCSECVDPANRSKGWKNRFKGGVRVNPPLCPRKLNKLPTHGPDDIRWQGSFYETDPYDWISKHMVNGLAQFKRNQVSRKVKALTDRSARQAKAPSVDTETVSVARSSVAGPQSQATSDSLDSRGPIFVDGGVHFRMRDGRESSDMYGSGSDEDSVGSSANPATPSMASSHMRDVLSNIPRRRTTADAVSESTTSSSLQHSEDSRRSPTPRGGRSQASFNSRGWSSASQSGSIDSRFPARSQSSAFSSDRSSAFSSDRSSASLETSRGGRTPRASRSPSRSDFTEGVVSHPGFSDSTDSRRPPSPSMVRSSKGDFWEPPERHTTMRQSGYMASSQRTLREGEKRVRHVAPGESGDEKKLLPREVYGKGGWMTDEHRRENDRKAKEKHAEYYAEQRAKDREDAARASESHRERMEAAVEKLAARQAAERRLEALDSSSDSTATEVERPKKSKSTSKGGETSKSKTRGKGKEPDRGPSSKKSRG
jgi:hypothetical protein